MGEFNKNRKLAFLPSGNHWYLHFIVLLHWIVVLGNVGAIFALPILFVIGEVPWYYGFPVMTWLSVSACTRIDSHLHGMKTKLEEK